MAVDRVVGIARYCNAHRTRFGWDTRGASNLPELHARLSDGVLIRRLKVVAPLLMLLLCRGRFRCAAGMR